MRAKEKKKDDFHGRSGLSVVVPFYNEEETLPLFCETMDNYVSKLEFSVEVVFVNDGSTDRSVDILNAYKFVNISNAKIVELSRNFGFHAAVRAGIQNARFDTCTWFGADLQEPLEIVDIAYGSIYGDGVEIVYFSKKTIKVSKINRLCSLMYSYLMKTFVASNWSSEGTATIAFGRKVKELLNTNVESNSSVALQIMNMGFEYKNVSLDYLGRSAGDSKWTLSKKIKLFIDSFASFSYVPIRLVSFIGIIVFILGLGIGIFTIINKFVNPDVQIGYSTIASVLAIGFGVTNISLGIIAEYLWRTLDAARKRPVYIVSNIVDLIGEN